MPSPECTLANCTRRICKPLFIVQGANDPRVPLSEAEQIRDKVRANGQETWYIVAWSVDNNT